MIKEKSPSKSKKKSLLLNFAAMNLGVIVLTFGVYLFEVPNHFAMGGVSGIAIILSHYFEQYGFTQPIILAILNIALLIVGFILLGRGLTLRTTYCTLAYTGLLNLLNWIHPMKSTLTDQPLLELIYAVVFVGGGSAILYQSNASSGGSDIIAFIVKKYSGWNIANAVLITDFVIGSLAFVAFRSDISIGLLSIFGIAIKTFIIDGVIDNITKTKYVTIITVNPDVVAEVILNNIKRGFTKYKAEGGYTGEERTVIITVCRRTQAARLKARLHVVDPTAFVIITNANEIVGNGFAEKM